MTEARPDLQVLFLSGYTEEAAQNHGVFDPAHAFLQMPFSSMTLARMVRKVLDADHR